MILLHMQPKIHRVSYSIVELSQEGPLTCWVKDSQLAAALYADLLSTAGFNGSDINFYTPPPHSQGGGLQLPNGTWTGIPHESGYGASS